MKRIADGLSSTSAGAEGPGSGEGGRTGWASRSRTVSPSAPWRSRWSNSSSAARRRSESGEFAREPVGRRPRLPGLPTGTPFHSPVTRVGMRTIPPSTKNAKARSTRMPPPRGSGLWSAWQPLLPKRSCGWSANSAASVEVRLATSRPSRSRGPRARATRTARSRRAMCRNAHRAGASAAASGASGDATRTRAPRTAPRLSAAPPVIASCGPASMDAAATLATRGARTVRGGPRPERRATAPGRRSRSCPMRCVLVVARGDAITGAPSRTPRAPRSNPRARAHCIASSVWRSSRRSPTPRRARAARVQREALHSRAAPSWRVGEHRRTRQVRPGAGSTCAWYSASARPITAVTSATGRTPV